jgi:hypothetical protein
MGGFLKGLGVGRRGSPSHDGNPFPDRSPLAGAMKDRSELSRIEFGKTRVRLTKDLSVMNPALKEGIEGLVVGKLANYTLKVQFTAVTVGVNWQDCDIVEGVTGMPSGAPPREHPALRGAPKETPKPASVGTPP